MFVPIKASPLVESVTNPDTITFPDCAGIFKVNNNIIDEKVIYLFNLLKKLTGKF